MKKFVTGLIVGVLLFTSVSVFAAPTSLIGQKVQGLFSIEKNGTKIADAVIINGSTYAPVRALAEVTGTNLNVEGKKIIMSDNASAAVDVPSTSGNVVTLKELQSKRSELVDLISKKETHVLEYKENQVVFWETLIKENPNSTTKTQWEKSLADGNKRLEEIKSELTSLQQQLAELDAQIADYKK